MKRIAIEPTTVLHPHPVLLVGTFGADGKANLMNAAWGGICCSDPPCVSVSLREATLTYHNILHSKAFSIGIPSRTQVEAADYVGIVSGRDCDKFQDTGLTAVKSEKVSAPIVTELPFSFYKNYAEFFEIDSVPEKERKSVSKKVADEILARLKSHRGEVPCSESAGKCGD